MLTLAVGLKGCLGTHDLLSVFCAYREGRFDFATGADLCGGGIFAPSLSLTGILSDDAMSLSQTGDG